MQLLTEKRADIQHLRTHTHISRRCEASGPRREEGGGGGGEEARGREEEDEEVENARGVRSTKKTSLRG